MFIGSAHFGTAPVVSYLVELGTLSKRLPIPSVETNVAGVADELRSGSTSGATPAPRPRRHVPTPYQLIRP